MDRQNHAGSYNLLVRYAPLWAHLSVYVLTCLVAAAFLYFGYRPVVVFVEYFSGAIVPTNYSSQQTAVLWALLLGAPALFAFGFVAAERIRLGGALFRKIAGRSDGDAPGWMPVLMFAAAASVGAYDLLRAGVFAKLSVWSDYGAWVEGRWVLFSALGYFNFVNLYLILPVSAAWVILSITGSGWKALAARLIPLTVVIVLTLLLFQKKALIVSLIIIFGAVLLHRIFSKPWTRRLTWTFVATTGLLASIYFLLVVLPVFLETTRTASQVLMQQEEKGIQQIEEGIQQVEKGIQQEEKGIQQVEKGIQQVEKGIQQVEKGIQQVEKGIQQVKKGIQQVKKGIQQEEKLLILGEEINTMIGSHRSAHIFAYAALAPMTRTSLPAMYYPIVYPELQGYYGFDFGQDILGFGGMPDDNLVIWKHMYPDLPGGAGAPFQFALYSQVGVVWTLLLCAMVGMVLGVLWQGILASDISRVWRSLMGTVLILFSIYLAIDSIRGSLLSSYGLIWAWLFISLSFFIGRSLMRRQELESA